MILHILCPSDLKERAYIALRSAVQIAHQFNARITILNVHSEFLDKEERRMLRVSVEKQKEKYRQIAFESKQEMKAAMQKLHAEDIDIQYMLRGGKPAKTIIDVAIEEDVNLIVMCTDGRDSLKDVVAGTITEQVISNAPCPVLVVPQNP
jgi:nucleotide-binding universal stress UspA family protein